MQAQLAQNVYDLRKKKNMTQSQLADLVGVKKSQISALENQQRLPSINLLIKLSYALNVSIEYLLGVSKNKTIEMDTYLFNHSNKNESITRTQAFRIIKEAADYNHISGVISCHSLRKTFGYHAWKQGVTPALLVTVFNHSSFDITKRYLGIEQDDKDKIFKKIKL